MDKIIEIGGSGQRLQMLHANAYTPECYNKFLAPFTAQYEVVAYHQRPLWPGADHRQLKNWSSLSDDLIKMMDADGRKNVIGMGHSLGAITTWLASLKRPDLFSQLILIDPVILSKKYAYTLRYLPFWLIKDKLPMIKIALNRRHKWPNRDAVRAHLSNKRAYKNFDSDVFDDFLEYALIDDQGEVKLAYSREWEAQVYATAPNLWPFMSKTKVPMYMIKAERSDVISPLNWSKIQTKTTNTEFYEMPDVGHLIPFEKPLLLSQNILKYLSKP